MTVAEFIKALEQVEDKSLDVVIRSGDIDTMAYVDKNTKRAYFKDGIYGLHDCVAIV